MSNWDDTRKQWLKEIRKREPTWKAESRSGQIGPYIVVNVGSNRYELFPNRSGRYSAWAVTQKQFHACYGDTLGDLMRHVRRWSKHPATPKKVKPLVHGEMSWDHRDMPYLEDLQSALEPFGLHVIEHPGCEGSDQYGYIISNRPLNEEELEEARGCM